ncbi:MAG TPA: TonB family protein [Steroidobacteraceae bacterium]|nr:TonB family protein [Steroidobacteraceae bacterium]
MASRALLLREGAAPIRDRLLMTIFVAAVLHGMIILGITFSAGARDGSSAPGMEVLLVSDEVPTAERNDTATYLAQRTQLGSGNARQPVAARNRAAALPESAPREAADSDVPEERVLTTSAQQTLIRYFGEVGRTASEEKARPAAEQPPTPAGAADDAGPVELRGPKRDELWVTPDTRESTVAPYLDSWRRRIERIGTLNYPTAARASGTKASPVLEVAIGADGKLMEAQVRRSSGDAALDQAALAILKLASPFDPFPPELAREHRSLRLTYEWQFVGGRVAGGTVSTVP